MVKGWSSRRSSLWLLRLSIASYLLGRVLDIDGYCSVIIWVTRGIAAGSVLATIELRVLLLEFADACVSSSIYSRLTLYVEDATVETIYTAKRICWDHAKATKTFTDALMGIRMLFSDTKNGICASSDKVARGIKGRLHGSLSKSQAERFRLALALVEAPGETLGSLTRG